jgi:hypothetical protein
VQRAFEVLVFKKLSAYDYLSLCAAQTQVQRTRTSNFLHPTEAPHSAVEGRRSDALNLDVPEVTSRCVPGAYKTSATRVLVAGNTGRLLLEVSLEIFVGRPLAGTGASVVLLVAVFSFAECGEASVNEAANRALNPHFAQQCPARAARFWIVGVLDE